MRDECKNCAMNYTMKGRCKGVCQENEGADCCFGHWLGRFSCREVSRRLGTLSSSPRRTREPSLEPAGN